MGENGIKRVGCEIPSTGMPTKAPPDIPSIWKKQAIEHTQSRNWLEAVVYGLTRHVWEDGEEMRGKLRIRIEQRLKGVIQKIDESRWGNKEELQKDSGGEAHARFIHHPDKDGKDVIILNRHLLGEEGNRELIDGSYVAKRCLALLHEGAHVLFRESGIIAAPGIKKKHEEFLVWKIKYYYFSKCSPLNTVGGIPSNIKRLFKSCKSQAIRDKDISETRGTTMAFGLDFNNDGLVDFVRPTGMSTYSWPVGVDPVEYEKSGAQDAPHIFDPTGKYPAGEMVSFDEWKGKGESAHVSVWEVSPWIYHRGWQLPAVRFFNDDRSMSFVPGDKVALRGSDAAITTAMVEGVVVLYDYKNKQRWGTIYLDFGEETKNHPGGKRFVSINDAVWVTAQGQPLDVQQAIKMAEAGGKTADGAGKTAEGEMAKLLGNARRQIQNIPPDQEIQKRKIVLELAKEFPYRKDLPAGWETSVLFALGLKPEYLDNFGTDKKTAMK